MQPISHPDTIRLIHETKVTEEMARHGGHPRPERDRPGPKPGDAIRATIGSALIAIGTRIAPARPRRPATAPR